LYTKSATAFNDIKETTEKVWYTLYDLKLIYIIYLILFKKYKYISNFMFNTIWKLHGENYTKTKIKIKKEKNYKFWKKKIKF